MKRDEMDALYKAINKLEEVTALLHEIVLAKQVPIDEEFLDKKIADIDWGEGTSRIRHMCRYSSGYSNPIVTVRDLLTISEAEMMRKPNFGRTSLNRIKAVLSAHGLKLNKKQGAT
jgi:DNA-directed RNA polymerase alpha subunit